MDYLVLAGVTLAFAAVVALVARFVAARIAGAAEGDLSVGAILLAILISLVVLQGAAKLAVIVAALYARIGIDPATACGGQFAVTAYGASFVPIAAYVVTFLLVHRRVKGQMP